MPAKPLPSDRELLLRLLDEAGQVLTGLEPVRAFVSARKEIRKLPSDPDGLRKISPLDLQLIKGRYEAAVNRLAQTSEPIPHGIGFLSPFLELPKEPREYMQWLRSFDFPLDQFEHIASKIILLRQQIAEKLADDSRTGHEYAPEAPEVSTTTDEAAPVAHPEAKHKSEPKYKRGELDSRAAIEQTKNPALTFDQLANMLGCNASTLRDQRKCPLLAKARQRIKAEKFAYRKADTWRDRRSDDE